MVSSTARRLRDGTRTVAWWFGAIVGAQDYPRYVEHLRRTHPDRAIPTEREYWRDRYADADRNPRQRCC
ncbi:YbdD/YjiX family protein [Nocardia bovistercoris]|uniref:YbdD/YjiX family protein n=1 Tax=Nocardia bovistercoris TaxID=2785916 RepID=UPI002FCD477E